MTDTTSPVSRIMTDGEPHPLTADTLDAMKTFLAAMAADKEVHAFVRDDVRSNYPALGYQLMVGSFEPSRYRNELVVVAEDSYAEADPQDQVYYDTFGAADGWTYMVRAGHSVSFDREGIQQKRITYVFLTKPAPEFELTF